MREPRGNEGEEDSESVNVFVIDALKWCLSPNDLESRYLLPATMML